MYTIILPVNIISTCIVPSSTPVLPGQFPWKKKLDLDIVLHETSCTRKFLHLYNSCTRVLSIHDKISYTPRWSVFETSAITDMYLIYVIQGGSIHKAAAIAGYTAVQLIIKVYEKCLRTTTYISDLQIAGNTSCNPLFFIAVWSRQWTITSISCRNTFNKLIVQCLQKVSL